MADAPSPDDDPDDLVAYLDGELDDETARLVEAKLSRDPKAREEAEGLKRTWELLDYLPRAEPSACFTHRTLERLQPAKATMARPDGQRWRSWLVAAGWAAAVVLSAAGGYFGMNTYQQRARADRDEELVRDLRLIENLRLYQQVDNLTFLRELDKPDLFGDEHPDS